MRKKISKITALVACLGFLSLTISAMPLNKPKAANYDLEFLLKKPVLIFSSMLSFLNPIIYGGKYGRLNTEKTNKVFKTSGSLNSLRLGDGD